MHGKKTKVTLMNKSIMSMKIPTYNNFLSQSYHDEVNTTVFCYGINFNLSS